MHGYLPTCMPQPGDNHQCKQNVADRNQGIALRFLEDGKALHLVLRLSDLGKPGACFMSKDVAPEKLPSDKNPCASTSHILCDNVRPGGGDKKCGKKVRIFTPCSNMYTP